MANGNGVVAYRYQWQESDEGFRCPGCFRIRWLSQRRINAALSGEIVYCGGKDGCGAKIAKLERVA